MMNKQNSKSWTKLALLGAFPLLAILMALNTRDELKKPIKEAITPVSTLMGNEQPEGLPIKKEQLIKVSSMYGMRMHPIEKKKTLHTGIDFVAEMGTPVYATAPGSVAIAKYDEKHGYFVKLDHYAAYQTQYSHLKLFVVMPGAIVTKGQLIGYVGNSGLSMAPHLHYEVHKSGEQVDPKDYMNLDNC